MLVANPAALPITLLSASTRQAEDRGESGSASRQDTNLPSISVLGRG